MKQNLNSCLFLFPVNIFFHCSSGYKAIIKLFNKALTKILFPKNISTNTVQRYGSETLWTMTTQELFHLRHILKKHQNSQGRITSITKQWTLIKDIEHPWQSHSLTAGETVRSKSDSCHNKTEKISRFFFCWLIIFCFCLLDFVFSWYWYIN